MTPPQPPPRPDQDARLSTIEEILSTLPAHEEREEQHWRFDRRISIGNLLTVVALTVAAATGWMTLTSRVDRHDVQLEAQKQTNERVERDMLQLRSEIRADLSEIKGDVKRISERIVAR